MKIDQCYRRRRCSRITSFWQYKVYADIRGGSLERGVKRQWVIKNVDFRGFQTVYVFDTLGNEANIIIVVFLALIRKYVTLNDLEILNFHFRLNFHYYEPRFCS